MNYFVYVLQSKIDFDLYIGVTRDIRRRLKEHNLGRENSTRTRKPFDLIFIEIFSNKIDAFNREKYLKSGWGRKHLRSALKYCLENSKTLTLK